MQGQQSPSCIQVVIDESSDEEEAASSSESSCRVCGEKPAAMHYGALACVGCKGFFRRALMKADQLECYSDGRCVVDKDLRTNCRSCRFQKCLRAGMKPAAVRPNRDVSAKQRKRALAPPEESVDCSPTSKIKDDWSKKLTVEMRTVLMNLLNIEAKVMKGDTDKAADELYPLRIDTLRQLLEDPTILMGKRSKMRYEPYRMAKNDELSSVAYRRLIAAVDWVNDLAELMGGIKIEDRIALVKNCFAPLMVFKFATRTAEVAKENNILCLCNFSYVPREISRAFTDSYHLGNGLVGRALDELVGPYREYGLREEEIVCVSAIIALNPLSRDVSEECFEKCMELRNRIQDVLFTIVKEARLSPHPSVCFGHLLLSLPVVTSLANAMCENLQFAQTFSTQGEIPLLTDLFGFTLDASKQNRLETKRHRTVSILLLHRLQEDRSTIKLHKRIRLQFEKHGEMHATSLLYILHRPFVFFNLRDLSPLLKCLMISIEIPLPGPQKDVPLLHHNPSFRLKLPQLLRFQYCELNRSHTMCTVTSISLLQALRSLPILQSHHKGMAEAVLCPVLTVINWYTCDINSFFVLLPLSLKLHNTNKAYIFWLFIETSNNIRWSTEWAFFGLRR